MHRWAKAYGSPNQCTAKIHILLESAKYSSRGGCHQQPRLQTLRRVNLTFRRSLVLSRSHKASHKQLTAQPSTSRIPILFPRRNVPFPSDGKRTLHGWNICPPDAKHPHNTKHSTIKGRLHLNKLTNAPLSPPYIQDIPQSPIPQQHSKSTPSS